MSPLQSLNDWFLNIFLHKKNKKNPRNLRNFTICENVSFKYVYN